MPTTTICAGWRASHPMDEGGQRRGAATVLQGHRTRPRILASAYGMAARCYARRKGSRLDGRPGARRLPKPLRLARRVVELGKDDAVALSTGGFALAYVVGDLDDGAALIDRALVLNPNLAVAWTLQRLGENFARRARNGDRALRARHAPEPARSADLPCESGIAVAHFSTGRYDEASSWAEKALLESPNYYAALRVAAASYALAGRLVERRKLWLACAS